MKTVETEIVDMGDSYGVIIPPEFLEVLDLKIGDVVNIELKDGCIFVTPVKKSKIRQLNLEEIILTLCVERPIFHSEADFQFALGVMIQKYYPDSKIRFEVPFYIESRKWYIDILVELEDRKYPIELKYKTKKYDYFSEEEFRLSNHGAGDFGSYDLLKDVQRIEFLSAKISDFERGFTIWLTNDQYYWKEPLKSGTGAEAFRTFEGSKKSGILNWSDAMTNIKGRENPIELENEYNIKWKQYSALPNKNGDFRYCLLEVNSKTTEAFSPNFEKPEAPFYVME